ncbi:DNA repair protein RAD51 homolog 4-like isoform X1 [Agrilus planipennis]|uniref:DNA repair protein RAD51 homolog 4-like isoform X1 n=1 Tax=Agrilus planipennis TaxID=224129 RepID=A0A1W4XIY3_AGRPL|nr:DNA repair protein RAD51 homolog 4-like isoform X1 [Agrilus planipennis]
MLRLCEDIHELFSKEVSESLFSVNIVTINDFLKVDIKKITASSGLSYKDVICLKKQIANKYAAVTRNGLKYYKEILTKSAIISSGIKSLDILLDGGFLTGQLYEICGLPASGKTQLCLTIAKHTATSFKKVYYLDSKMDFTGRRLKEMLENTRDIKQVKLFF